MRTSEGFCLTYLERDFLPLAKTRMASNGEVVTESQLRKYGFPTEPIKRISISDPKADEYVSSGVSIDPCQMIQHAT